MSLVLFYFIKEIQKKFIIMFDEIYLWKSLNKKKGSCQLVSIYMMPSYLSLKLELPIIQTECLVFDLTTHLNIEEEFLSIRSLWIRKVSFLFLKT